MACFIHYAWLFYNIRVTHVAETRSIFPIHIPYRTIAKLPVLSSLETSRWARYLSTQASSDVAMRRKTSREGTGVRYLAMLPCRNAETSCWPWSWPLLGHDHFALVILVFADVSICPGMLFCSSTSFWPSKVAPAAPDILVGL